MSSRQPAVGFILVTLLLDILGIGLIVPVLPNLLKEFVHHDEVAASHWYGLIVATYAGMQFLCAPLIGGLSDRFGRRPVLLLSNFGMGLDYLVMAFAPSLGWLFLGRLMSGIAGASIGSATAYIADVSPPEKRAANFGLVGAAFGVGFILGPALGGALGKTDLRLPFFVSAGLCLANAAWGFFVLPESLSKDHRRPFTASSANPVGTLATLARYPLVLSLAVAIVFFYLAQRGLESCWVLYTSHRFHWDPLDAGLSLACVGLGAAVVQGGLARKIIPWLGERRSLVVGTAIAVGSYVFYGLANHGWMIYAALPIFALGGIGGPSAQALMSKAVPPNEQGLLQGGLASLGSVTSFFGAVLATSLFSYFISDRAPFVLPGAPFFSSAILCACGLVATLWTFSRFPAK